MTGNKKKTGKKHGYARKDIQQVSIAKEHIANYFSQAKAIYRENPTLANRYVTLARKVAMKFKIRLTREQKRLFCPHCYKFAMPGDNSRVRLYKGKLSYFCQNCGKSWRMPLSPGKDDK